MRKRQLGLVLTCLAWAVGCAGPGASPSGSTSGGGDGPTTPFEPLSVNAQVAKVKYLLTGLAPTQEEIDAVAADKSGNALRGLIDKWMATPEFGLQMQQFFQVAFQQGQLQVADIEGQIGFRLFGDDNLFDLLRRNVQDSFPLTVWKLVSEGRPFTEALTTNQYMMTPPLKALMAAAEGTHLNDNQKADEYQLSTDLRNKVPNVNGNGDPIATFIYDPNHKQQISTQDFANPKSPNFFTWNYFNHNATDPQPLCSQPRSSNTMYETMLDVYDAAYGYVNSTSDRMCHGYQGGHPMWTEDDFSNWQLTTIRKPQAGESPSRFYAVDDLRKPGDLVLKAPHIGFFGTYAFQANYPSNKNNLLRVMANQSLIVALGRSVDGEQTIFPILSPTTAESEHADPNGPCYGCHQTLDPLRKFFASDLTVSYRDQRDPAMTALQGDFAGDGVEKTGHGVGDIAAIYVSHPRFPVAWTQKLCWYANSVPCAEDDPEFLRIASVFKDSKFDFKTLVRELFSSPIVTLASFTATYKDQDPMVSISPRGHFCDALSNRLGMPDLCNLYSAPAGGVENQAARFSLAIPAIGYARGGVDPVMPTEVGMIPTAAVEKFCITIAPRAVDAPTGTKYSSADDNQVSAAIDDMVHNLMGLTPEDGRAAKAVAALKAHFDASLEAETAAKSKTPRTLALQSTFVVACQAPSLTAIGL